MPRWKVPAGSRESIPQQPIIPDDPTERLRLHCKEIYRGDWSAFQRDLELLLASKPGRARKANVRRDLPLVRLLAAEAGRS